MPLASNDHKNVAAGLAVWVILFYAFPSIRPHLDEEDHLAENLAVLLLGITFLLGLGLALRRRERMVRWFSLGVALLAAVAVGDELSFGERLFAIEMPKVGETKFDGAHDIVEVIWSVKWARALWAVAALFLIWLFRAKLKVLLNWALQRPPVVMFLLAWSAVFCAVFLDLHIIDFGSRHAIEEYFELVAASSLLGTLILLARHGLKPVYAREAAPAQVQEPAPELVKAPDPEAAI